MSELETYKQTQATWIILILIYLGGFACGYLFATM